MSDAAALARKLGVDVSKVQEILDSAESQAPAQSSERIGFARCFTPGCELNDVDREIRFRIDTMETRASDLPITVSATQYLIPVEDSETKCPECGGDCALMPTKPPTYPKMVA